MPDEKTRRSELERKAREAARAISFITPNPKRYMVEVDKLTGGVSVLPIRSGLHLDGTISIDRQGSSVKLSHGEGVTKISR
jgi:hypothetical protein